MMQSMIEENKLAFTVDLEFLEDNHYPDESDVRTADKEKKAVRKLLDILDEKEQKITFFTVAELCNNHLEFLEEIRDRGHEIASHTSTHPDLTSLSNDELENEVTGSKERLEKELDIEVKGFRAPMLKTNERVLQAVEDAGYEYDSSVTPSIPIPGWYGGNKNFKPFSRGSIKEIPVSANPVLKTPISGFFLRALGKRHLEWSIRLLLQRGITPVFYVHPYELAEFDGKKNWRQRFRSGEYSLDILKHLIKEYKLETMGELNENS